MDCTHSRNSLVSTWTTVWPDRCEVSLPSTSWPAEPVHTVFNDVRDAVDACQHVIEESQMREIATFHRGRKRILNCDDSRRNAPVAGLGTLSSPIIYEGINETHLRRDIQGTLCGLRVMPPSRCEGVRQSLEESGPRSRSPKKSLRGRILAATSGASQGR
jgi:hypothetical protein